MPENKFDLTFFLLEQKEPKIQEQTIASGRLFGPLPTITHTLELALHNRK